MRVSSAAIIYLISAAAAAPVEQPVCTNDDGTWKQEPTCGLWLAESMVDPGTLGIFIGVNRNTDETVGEGDLHVPIYDANLNHWSLWHDIMWNGDIQDDLFLQNHFQTKSFVPGVGSNLVCSEDLANVRAVRGEAVDSAGVKRSDPSAGSFSYRHDSKYNSTMPLIPGQELLIQCAPGVHHVISDAPRIVRPVSWLEENAVCLDKLTIKTSTIPGAGRGAFTKRKVKRNKVIVTSPIVQFDRLQTEIVEQYDTPEGVIYKEKVKQLQLLYNYVFGHVNSTILLLPYGPGVNFINHHNEKPNAILAWSDSIWSHEEILKQDALGAMEIKRQSRLLVDYVALRDIEPGEEIFLDYGREWQKAWDEHVSTWKPPKDSKEYVSAADFLRAHPGDAIRTEEEQNKKPYPSGVQTSCYFMEIDKTEFDHPYGYDSEAEAIYYNKEAEAIYYNKENEGCLRPCKILERQVVNGKENYSVEVEEMPNVLTPDDCLLNHKRQKVLRTPTSVITITDKEYTADQFLPDSFRHEITVPEDMYPENWKIVEHAMPMGDFELPDLKPGEIQQIRWKESGDVVTENAHVMGMKPQVREKMLEYCDRMGITERFRDLTYRGNPLDPGESEDIKIQGLNWHVQRPPPNWNSNMHWISPSDANAHEDYLRALSASGFDEVLQQIGKHFGFKGLAAYHVTFIAVSQCSEGYIHYDATHTGAKVFNVIFPLLLANETGPELDLQDNDKDENGELIGRLRYKYDVASMMGDDAYHATSAADYRRKKEMRMAATVYIADIGEDNIRPILADFTQSYPSKDRPDLLLRMAGKHWRANDPYVKLPVPFVRDFEDYPIIDFKILPMTWKRTQKPVSGFAHRIGVPSTFRSQLLDYATNLGITKRYQNLLLDGEELQVHSSKTQGVMEEFKGLHWYIQRPPGFWDSNMHWISPGDAATHEDFLKQLSLGGFDKVLESIGEYFELDGLVAYHLSFMAVSHCVRGYVHHDFSGTQGKAFNIIVPLITVDGTSPELEIKDTDDQTGGYRYVYDEASIIGDYARHATGRVDYREQGKYRLAVYIYIADVNEGNAKAILKDFTQAYPPQAEEGEELLLSWAGRHWKPSAENKQWWNKHD
jgi:hypothetical protein